MGWTTRLCGRDKLVERIWAWKEHYVKRILGQLRDLGASCDWDRTRLTGSLTSCPRRGSTGIATTGCLRRITSSGPPSRRWRKGNIGKRREAVTGGHAAGGRKRAKARMASPA